MSDMNRQQVEHYLDDIIVQIHTRPSERKVMLDHIMMT